MTAIYYLSFALLLARAVRASLLIDVNSWMTTEMLVSYEAGFVRRGLLGQVLWEAREYGLPLEPKYLLAFFGLLTWGAVGILLERWSRYMEVPGRVFILFSPLVAFSPLLDTGSFPRKDIIAVAFTVVHLLCLRLASEAYTRSAIFGFLVFSPLAVLTHEGFIFLALPINLILFFFATRYRGGARGRSILLTLLISLPSFVAAIAAVASKGDVAHAAVICSKWSTYYSSLNCSPLPGSFGAIASGAEPYIRITVGSLGTRRFIYSFALTSVYLVYHFIWLGRYYVARASLMPVRATEVARTPPQQLSVIYFCFPGIVIALCLLASSPLYIAAVDYIRWLGVVTACSTLSLLSPDSLRANSFLIGEESLIANKLSPASRFIWSSPFRALVNLFQKYRNCSLVFSFFATAPHCCVVFLVPGGGALLTAIKLMTKSALKTI